VRSNFPLFLGILADLALCVVSRRHVEIERRKPLTAGVLNLVPFASLDEQERLSLEPGATDFAGVIVDNGYAGARHDEQPLFGFGGSLLGSESLASPGWRVIFAA
jgi:hypothetical protein